MPAVVTGAGPFRIHYRLCLLGAENPGRDGTLQHLGKIAGTLLPRHCHVHHYPPVSTRRPSNSAAPSAATPNTPRRVHPLSNTRRTGPDSAKPASRNGTRTAVLVSDCPVTCPAAASAASEITERRRKYPPMVPRTRGPAAH